MPLRPPCVGSLSCWSCAVYNNDHHALSLQITPGAALVSPSLHSHFAPLFFVVGAHGPCFGLGRSHDLSELCIIYYHHIVVIFAVFFFELYAFALPFQSFQPFAIIVQPARASSLSLLPSPLPIPTCIPPRPSIRRCSFIRSFYSLVPCLDPLAFCYD
jgi:hypothetical protein